MAGTVACLCLVTPGLWGKEKITVEELVASHLDSIGTAEARARVESITATGNGSAIPRIGGSGKLVGSARMLSEPGKSLIYMNFATPDYAEEALLFDGESVEVGQMSPGQRSPLGNLLKTQELPLREGLIGGTLSRDWPFLNLPERDPKLKYKGLRKLDGVKYHEVEYKARKGKTDFRIRLYFEQETFRHVLSDYRMSISASMGSRPIDSSQQSETRYVLIEEFSDFRQEGGLTLPHKYVIRYTREGNATLKIDWELELEEFTFNQPLQGAFKIDP
ncbi:MAG TPA: hypothetical protein VLU25_21985 [Acidobacteriota bacterium]|nr:hypothetical protein [Acidobacteriota bacterium]